MTAPRTEPAGVLLLDKPVGPTSHDMVVVARRALGLRRVGHTGTLDPFASGLLLLCVGWATRLAEYLTRLDKRYRGEVRLGETTDTADPTGTVVARSDAWRDVTRDHVAAALAAQIGEILQVPPAFSAKKVGGVPMHRLARRGEAVRPVPARVVIHSIEIVMWAPPSLTIDVACSSGTYVRAIARDLGATLGCGAHLAALRRTAVGPHGVEAALAPAEIGDPGRYGAAWLSPTQALGHLATVTVDEAESAALRQGRAVAAAGVDAGVEGTLAAIGPRGLLAVVEAHEGLIRPRKVFPE
jgi:tRNA pseudouridine55 synthase